MQKIFIKTFGCQMNEYDSNRIFDSVKKIGYQKSENQEEELRKYKKGDQVKTIILSVDAERERVSLGIKQLDSD